MTNAPAAALTVVLTADDVSLTGDLVVPGNASGLVAFAHGSGSGRLSPRNQRVAGRLHDAGIGTLLFDLLTAEEECRDRPAAELRFDIPLLSRRVVAAVDWLRSGAAQLLPIGLFGASTGAAAALVAAAARPGDVAAVVPRGGRPDLAGAALPAVRGPTLLIVGGADELVLELNRQALEQLRAEKRLDVIPGATHLFEEPGALEQVAGLAADWFRQHFGKL